MTDGFLRPKFENIPDQLKRLPWAVWRAEPRQGHPEKFNKAPLCPISGRKIGANKPELFGTFDAACAAYQSGNHTGVGVLLIGNGVVGIDIDDVVANMMKQPALPVWITAALDANIYCEKSPSGQGLRLFMLGGPLPQGAMRKHEGLEIYDNLRFLTVTGHIVKRRAVHA